MFLTHTVRENRLVEFELISDVAYSAEQLPEGATFDEQRQLFSWRPRLYNSAGLYEAVFLAPDASKQTVTIAVQDVELPEWYQAFLTHQQIVE